ncbi:MAG TPA: hypothetical protein VE010_06660 [Thermoanaerobaculia bacterium]|nr:hypothetical protein [Thermoanaerobaculia bacterium]
MFLLAAVLTASINIDIDLTSLVRRANQAQPKATCNISTVGYRFRGKPGQEFRYAGDTYEIPAEGWVELIADRRRTSYGFNGQTLTIADSPRDPFGFRDVTLPSESALNTDAVQKGETK